MSSLVHEWQRKHRGKQQQAVEKLNKICGGNARSSELSEIKAGKRPLRECFHFMMLNECLADILEDAGYQRDTPMTSLEWTELLEKLSPPKRGGRSED